MDRLRKAFVIGGTAVVTLLMGLALAVPAYAEEGVAPASTEDRAFSFSLSSEGDVDGTAWREKNDYSATYVNPTYFFGYRCRVYVDGSKYEDGSDRDQGCMIGTAYLFDTGKYVIHNNVKERGNGYAQMTVWACEGGTTITWGLWSPDVTDASKYTSLN